MATARQIAVVQTCDELVAALRARVREFEVTHETMDLASGLQVGCASKLLAPVPIKIS